MTKYKQQESNGNLQFGIAIIDVGNKYQQINQSKGCTSSCLYNTRAVLGFGGSRVWRFSGLAILEFSGCQD